MNIITKLLRIFGQIAMAVPTVTAAVKPVLAELKGHRASTKPAQSPSDRDARTP